MMLYGLGYGGTVVSHLPGEDPSEDRPVRLYASEDALKEALKPLGEGYHGIEYELPDSDAMPTNADLTKWLRTINRERLHRVAEFVWREGVRRGYDRWWMQ